MDPSEHSKHPSPTGLAAICQRARLGEEACALLQEGMGPKQYLELLINQNLAVDSLKFLAAALPKRAAVWWACLCLEQQPGYEPSDFERAALSTARIWVADPHSGDEYRRAAFPAAESAGFGTPAGCTALAAYLSGGSLAPVEFQAVPPAEHLTAEMVVNALILAAVTQDPANAAEKYDHFLKLGMDVAGGKHPWPKQTS